MMSNNRFLCVGIFFSLCLFQACEKPKSRLLDKELLKSNAQFNETQIDAPTKNVPPAFDGGKFGGPFQGMNQPPVQPPLHPYPGGPGLPLAPGPGQGLIPPIPTDDDVISPLEYLGSDFGFPLVPPARCGDGIVQIGEECDLGTCTAIIRPPNCNFNGQGNGGCNLYCQRPFCGNFITELGEECDDGNHENGDGCSYDCTYERCGNQKIDFITPDIREQCDDGATNPGDGCSPCCMFEICGNGIIDFGEQCDLGKENGKEGSNCNHVCEIVNCPAGLSCTTGTTTQICS